MKSTTKTTEWGDWFHEGDAAATHERLGNASWAWMFWALVLEHSADDIWQRHAYEKWPKGVIRMPMQFCVAAMLIGYAVECALKALWVRKYQRKLVVGGRYMRVPSVADHDLLQLARAVGLTTSSREDDVLRRLSKFSQFAGRYPIAKTPEKMLPHETTAGKVDICYFSPQDFRISNSVLQRIFSKVSGKKRPVMPRRRSPARFIDMAKREKLHRMFRAAELRLAEKSRPGQVVSTAVARPRSATRVSRERRRDLIVEDARARR